MKKASATPHTNALTDQPFSEKNVIAKEEKLASNSSHSAMAVEGLSLNYVAQAKKSTTYYSAVQKSMVFEEFEQMNISEENTGVDTESENVAGTHSEVDITGDDLPAASVLEESSKSIMAPTDETTSVAKGNELQCSEIESERIESIVGPSHAVNLPANLDLSSHSQFEVHILHVYCYMDAHVRTVETIGNQAKYSIIINLTKLSLSISSSSIANIILYKICLRYYLSKFLTPCQVFE